MNHIAIDLGASKSQICIRNFKGQILKEQKVETRKLGDMLRKQEKSRVVMETCSESLRIADCCLERGHEVRIVPGHLVRSLGVGQHGIKNDRRDAQALSEVSTRIDLPSVHLRSKESREISVMLKMRDQLVKARTRLINNVQGWMRTQTLRIRAGSASRFCQRLRDKEKALPVYVEHQLMQIEALTKAIEVAEENLSCVAEKIPDFALLRSIPGIGLLNALTFYSTIDEVHRFRKAHQFQSYVGLTPGEKSSGMKQRTTSITKAGSSMLRWLLIQAAWTTYLHRPNEPIVLWTKAIEKRRGRKIAIVALARKLAGILFAVWKEKRPYQPMKTNRQIQ